MSPHLDPLNARLAMIFLLALAGRELPLLKGMSADFVNSLISTPLKVPMNRLFEASRVLGVERGVGAILCEIALPPNRSDSQL